MSPTGKWGSLRLVVFGINNNRFKLSLSELELTAKLDFDSWNTVYTFGY